MRLVVCGGGTAGHIYPAISVAKAVERHEPGLSVLAIGTNSASDRTRFEAAGYAFHSTSAAPIVGARLALPFNVLRMTAAIISAMRKIADFKPNVALSTGAYASIPGAAACLIQRVPQVLIAVDARPGRAARLIGRFASYVASATLEALAEFPPERSSVTGLPLRDEFNCPNAGRARRRLGIDGDVRLLMVIGGSQGSTLLNDTIGSVLEQLLELANVVHLTGDLHIARYEARKSALPSAIRGAYHPLAYLDGGMADLMAASDLAIARAGGTTQELVAAGLPSVLIPGLFAGGHQKANADRLAEGGASVTLSESDLSGGELLTIVRGLLNDDSWLREMKNAAARLAKTDAAERIAEKVLELGKGGGR